MSKLPNKFELSSMLTLYVASAFEKEGVWGLIPSNLTLRNRTMSAIKHGVDACLDSLEYEDSDDDK